jgi:hypothetical protein
LERSFGKALLAAALLVALAGPAGARAPGKAARTLDCTAAHCLIDSACSCESADNHGAYVSCVAHAVTEAIRAHVIPKRCHGRIVSCAGRSSCGKPNGRGIDDECLPLLTCNQNACTTAADCDDSNACTTDTCEAGVCGHDAIPGCKTCTSPADCATPCGDFNCVDGVCVSTGGSCDDNNPCTTDTCGAEGCVHSPIPGCTTCTTASDCDDQNACTTDTCEAGACAHSPIAGCTACTTAGDCDDQSICTTDSCTEGRCEHQPEAGCEPCTTAGDCDDHNACTTDECEGGRCEHDAVSGCQPCTTAADCSPGDSCKVCEDGICQTRATPPCEPCTTDGDCDDQNACTADACTAGLCTHDAIPGCVTCTTAADCGDGNACTTDTCDAGVCHNSPIAGCIPCTSAGDCGDGDPCTTDACDAGACVNSPISGCTRCTTPADCNDGNACTTETCTDGVCGHTPVAGCVFCTTAADCGDGDPCTTDTCTADRMCTHAPVPGCVRCTTASQCNDDNPCTRDECGTDGSCAITVIPGCVRCATDAECQDNDPCTADACTDRICAHMDVPGCREGTPEICGDCIDNDNDGLVDYEDPDCCAQQVVMGFTKTQFLHRHGNVRRGVLRIRSILALAGFSDVDPLKEDVSIQFRNSNGLLLCTTVGHEHWMKMHKKFKFWDRSGRLGHGLTDATIKVKRNGQVKFGTFGPHFDLTKYNQLDFTATVRVGNRCSKGTVHLRQSRKGLTFP